MSADARVTLRPGKGKPLHGVLERLSSSEACVRLRRPVRSGSRVELIIARRRFPATVRFCVLHEGTYFIGVAFE